MDMCYIKKKPLTKNKVEAYYLNVYASEYSHYRHLFFSKQLSTYVNRVQCTVVKAILF